MKLVSVVAARPNFVKLASIHHALKGRKDCEHVIVHTGQHYDPLFSDVFFEQLEIPLPNHNLGIAGGDRVQMIARTKEALLPVLEKEKPDIVLVYGDVNGALAAAETAHDLRIRIAHIEAGLRSGDLEMPEEHNRIGVDRLSDFLFCTEQSGMQHLEEELVQGKHFLVGNTMIDTLLRMMPLIEMEKIQKSVPRPFAIVTLHRPSNVDTKESLKRNMDFLEEVAALMPIVLPVHHRLGAALEKFQLWSKSENMWQLEALDYLSFLKFVMESSFVLTDSGGIQEEATFLRKRCFTLRKNTERPATIESGSNVLIDLAKNDDRAKVLAYAKNPVPPQVTIPTMWDGKAGERIVEILSGAL